MSIKIKAIARKNPTKPTDPPLYYVQNISTGLIDLNELADLISDGSTVRRNDIYAVLIGLTDVTIKELKKGHSVRFGELGIFHTSIKSNATDSQDKVNPSLVSSCKIRFRAGVTVKNALKSAQFTIQQ